LNLLQDRTFQKIKTLVDNTSNGVVQTAAVFSMHAAVGLSNMVGPCLPSVKMYSWGSINMLKNIEELDCLFSAAYVADIVLTVLYLATLFAVFLHPTFV